MGALRWEGGVWLVGFTVIGDCLYLEDFISIRLEAGGWFIGAFIKVRLLIRSKAREMEHIVNA